MEPTICVADRPGAIGMDRHSLGATGMGEVDPSSVNLQNRSLFASYQENADYDNVIE